jgi:hypothetical protein
MKTTDSGTVNESPRRRWLVLSIAFVTYGVLTLLGVLFWFKPIADGDQASGPLLSAPLNLAIYAALSVVLYDWAVRRTRDYFATAFVIGAAQYLLVVDLTLRGERGLATAGASAALIVLTWVSVALVYRQLAARRPEEQDPRV